MIPVTIICGFLGSGKTTLLNHLLAQEHQERVGVLVNDYGTIDIDGELVTKIQGETLSLSGGCICCSIRGDLVNAICDLLAGDEPPKRLVIEASGVSDPLPLAMTFFNGPLRDLCRLETLISMLDCDAFFDNDAVPEHLFNRQLEVADLIILNKTDLCSVEHVDKIEKEIHSKFPYARLLRTSQARVPKKLLFEPSKREIRALARIDPLDVHVHEPGVAHGHHHDAHQLVFDTWSFTHSEPLDHDRLLAVLVDLPNTVYRAKGFVQIAQQPQSRLVVHIAGRRVQQFRAGGWGKSSTRTQLVFLCKHGSKLKEQIQARLIACAQVKPKQERKLPDGASAWAEKLNSRLRTYADKQQSSPAVAPKQPVGK